MAESIPIGADHAGFELKAKLVSEHNDANGLVLPARFVTEPLGIEMLKTWLETPFAGGRHARRVAKIDGEFADA